MSHFCSFMHDAVTLSPLERNYTRLNLGNGNKRLRSFAMRPTWPSGSGYPCPCGLFVSCTSLPSGSWRWRPYCNEASSRRGKGGLWNCGAFSMSRGFVLGLCYKRCSPYDPRVNRYCSNSKDTFWSSGSVTEPLLWRRTRGCSLICHYSAFENGLR